MALKDLVARLESDAQARVDGIRERAEEAVRALEAGTLAELSRDAAARLAKQRAQRKRELDRTLAEATRRTRTEALEARRALLERIFARANEVVADVGASPAYLRALPAHLDEALAYLATLRPLVRCRKEVLPLLQAHARGRDEVKVLADDGLGPGLVAAAADGSVEVDNTLAARLGRLRGPLAVALLAEVDRARP